MGSCMSSASRSNSKMELSDASSNIFRVTNIDDNGVSLWNGQLGLSRTEITLYRKNLEPTRWPLKCLRRYGYDTELFSFEVGRRCATGEGIYAFKCRRAETLFQTLQTYIQMSTTVGDDTMGNSTISRNDASSPMSTLSNQNSTTNNMVGSYILPNSRSSNTNTLRNVPSDDQRRSYDASDTNYLEPILATNLNRTMPHFHTLADGTISVEPLSPSSPSSLNNILEVTSLNPLPNTGLNNNGVSNLYSEFVLRGNNTKDSNSRENCVKKLSLDIPPQEYAPTAANSFSSPIDASALHSQVIANANQFNGNQMLSNENLPHSLPVSPTQSNDTSDSIPTYVNVNMTPGEISSSAASTPKVLLGDYKQSQLFRNNINNNNYLVDSTHCYENLEPNEVRPILLRNQNRRLSLLKTDSVINSPTIINENISEPSTPNNSGGVNYIVLDLDQSHSQPTAPAAGGNANTETTLSSSSSPVKNPNAIASATMSPSVSASTTTHSVSSLMLPDSPQRKAFDYVTIDFNKTNALSNSIAPTTECEGSRKTRHSSNVLPNVPPAAINANTPSSHSNSVSD
ncbi:fibroblast growth factor receptor substrate 2 [Sitodiplosis mosellana]|uniref:fibroblast growth factor receptor substrate 2 n=1 Tax=Sitodiplosis mosellana TaxID=263140 RepID=UPI002444ABEC|nr:fibroblast growth factor receptor substrate 2 [Sitodiplosis mosellana]